LKVQIYFCVGQSGQIIPALGLAWSEQVNTRILLQRKGEIHLPQGFSGGGAGPADAAAGTTPFAYHEVELVQ
jgi:hypothetical protein